MGKKQVVLLDGGMGQELVRRSGREPTPMWSAQVMMDQPDVVRDLHIDYIRAGARVITLNAYSATPERLARDGSEEAFETLQKAAIRVAREARDRAETEGVFIAGCLPPLVASYRPEVAPDFASSLEFYRQIVEQQAGGVDYFLCETMASVKEARASATAASESGKPVWVGLTVADDQSGRLRSGEPLGEALAALDAVGVEAKLINCSQPESISACWPELSANTGAIGAYANAFTSIAGLAPGGTVDVLETRGDLGPVAYADIAMRWVDDGAAIVGGCCEVGPQHIAELSRRLYAGGASVTGRLPVHSG